MILKLEGKDKKDADKESDDTNDDEVEGEDGDTIPEDDGGRQAKLRKVLEGVKSTSTSDTYFDEVRVLVRSVLVVHFFYGVEGWRIPLLNNELSNG